MTKFCDVTWEFVDSHFKGVRATISGVPVTIWGHPNGKCSWVYRISLTVKISSTAFDDIDECKASFEKELTGWNWKEAVLYWKNKGPEPFKNLGEGI